MPTNGGAKFPRPVGRIGSCVAFTVALATAPGHTQEVIELTGEDRWLQADFQELYRLGTLDGEDWEQFGMLFDVDFGPGGDLYVLDMQTARLFVVGTDGRLVTELGGKGEGPGEFGYPVTTAVLTDGRVVVGDLSRRGYHMFAPGGEFQRMVPMSGDPAVTTVGFFEALPGADAVIRVPTLAKGVMFTADAFRGPLELPSSHMIVRTSLTGEEAETDTVGEAWLAPVNFEDMPETLRRNVAPAPTTMLPEFSPNLYMGTLPDGRLALADSSTYAVKIVEPGRGVTRVLTRPVYPEPMSGRMIRAEKDRRLRRLEDAGVAGDDLTRRRTSIENLQFADEIPVIRGLGTTWDGRIWVLRYGEDPSTDGPVDVLAPDGRYLGSYPVGATGLPAAFGPDGLIANVETDALGVQTVVVRRVVER